MNEQIFATLQNITYTRSGMTYAIGLIKSLVEFCFFTEHLEKINKEAIAFFLKEQNEREDGKNVFLKSLPESFWGALTKENFYDTLNMFTKKSEELPTLYLTVSTTLSEENIEEIGKWSRREINPSLMLDIKVEPDVSVGCKLVWNDQLHDFSISHYLEEHKTELHQQLSAT